jgi:FkbM family methyltransferase
MMKYEIPSPQKALQLLRSQVGTWVRKSPLDRVVGRLRGRWTVVDPRFPKKPMHVHRTALGTYFVPADSLHDIVAGALRTGQVFEPEIIETARRYIKPGTIAIDVGANYGQMSMLFSELVGVAGQVIAFEADDYIFCILQRNIEANGADNVRAYLAAVYDHSGEQVFYPEQDFKRFSAYGAYGIDPNALSGRTITTLAIDDLQITEPVSFFKIDAQGSDLFALRGARETIRHHGMPIVFEYEERFQAEFKTTFQDYLDFLQEISYRVERTVYGINYVCIPDTRKSVTVPAKATWPSSKSSSRSAAPQGVVTGPRCGFLRSRAEIEQCTKYLHSNGLFSHGQDCKDWDLARLASQIGDGNLLDMGSSDSYVLRNAVLCRLRGEKYGIDLRPSNVPLRQIKYLVGDICAVPLADRFFKTITCLSVVEHGVDFERFARESARLLEPGGHLYVTFDYWEPKITPTIRLYDRSWQPLDRRATEDLIAACQRNSLRMVEDMDWTIDEPVIRHGYHSPEPSMAYTFGMAVFVRD